MTEQKLFSRREVKNAWFTTLSDLGFKTSVSLHNPLPVGRFSSDDFEVELDLFDSDGSTTLSSLVLARLASGDRITIDVSELLQHCKLAGDFVGAIRMVPQSLIGESQVALSRNDLIEWTSICDEFVGYTHIESGVVSGVHYQSPPMNDERLPSTRTMIVQSPKVVIGQHVDSHLLVFSPSTDPTFCSRIWFHIAVLNRTGDVMGRRSILIPARGRCRVSISEILRDADSYDDFVKLGGLGMVVGLAVGGVLSPLSLVHDDRGGLAVDHTLPPPYYVPWWGGEARKSASKMLIETLFPGVEV